MSTVPPISALHLPPPALAGCVMAAIWRDTRGAALSPADRVNHFPASPLVAVTWIAAGALHLIPPGAGWREAATTPVQPRCFVTGPSAAPLSSWAPGPVAALTLAIYPEAWRALGGDAAFRDVPPPLAAAISLCDKGWPAVAAALCTLWADQRQPAPAVATRLSDWVRATTTRAALSGPGQSLRSMERRIKRASGQTRRTLDFFCSVEAAHARSLQDDGASLAEVALDAGFSDQSHMGRAVRRVTGFSPARLNRAIATEESFWCYRLLGERF